MRSEAKEKRKLGQDFNKIEQNKIFHKGFFPLSTALKYSQSSRNTANRIPAIMNRMLAANKYEKCSKIYFPLLSLMMEITDAVTTMENSIAKYGQKLMEL